MANQPTRERLIAKIVDVGMLRRDVATDYHSAAGDQVLETRRC